MTDTDTSCGFTKEDLTRYVDRIETLEREKKDISEAISEVFEEAKSTGFDVKALRQVIKMRKMDQEELEKAEAMVDLYMSVLNSGPRIRNH